MEVNCMVLGQVIDVLLHNGLTTYKQKNSKALLPDKVAANKNDQHYKHGAVFAVRSKDHFTAQGVKGHIITSKETLLEQAHTLTHFTPNIYRTFHYTDESRRYISGFEERNLLQINTFVVDIDTKKYSPQQITLACLDHCIGVPTLIIESDRGYQLFFALDTPMFVSNKDNYKCLTVAKRIAANLKQSLHCVEADPFCNDFGFFRMPTEQNIVFKQLQVRYSFNELIEWSIRFNDNHEQSLFVLPTLPKSPLKLTQTEWFYALVQGINIKGKKGQLGRNNTLFTLALACYADGWDFDRTFDFLDEQNTRLTYPLPMREVHTLLTSAYSGKYTGPSKQYVEILLEQYTNVQIKVQTKPVTWYKFKKSRDQRVKSHYTEWEDDLISYITTNTTVLQPFIWHTQKELCEKLQMPKSSLNDVLKHSNKLIKIVSGKGRGAKTGWTTVDMLRRHFIEQKKSNHATYISYVQAITNCFIKNEASKIIIAFIQSDILLNTS